MRLAFVTTNKHKFAEVQDILAPFLVELEWINREYPENHDESIETIARGAVKTLTEELERPVVLEDTGLFFDAFPGFPGALPKFAFSTLGYEGLLKLLAGSPRGAVFRTAAGLCFPGAEPQVFVGEMRGVITEEIYDRDADVMPYDRIFIPEGADKTTSHMTLLEKNAFSQRGKAFRRVGEYVRDHK